MRRGSFNAVCPSPAFLTAHLFVLTEVLAGLAALLDNLDNTGAESLDGGNVVREDTHVTGSGGDVHLGDGLRREDSLTSVPLRKQQCRGRPENAMQIERSVDSRTRKRSGRSKVWGTLLSSPESRHEIDNNHVRTIFPQQQQQPELWKTRGRGRRAVTVVSASIPLLRRRLPAIRRPHHMPQRSSRFQTLHNASSAHSASPSLPYSRSFDRALRFSGRRESRRTCEGETSESLSLSSATSA